MSVCATVWSCPLCVNNTVTQRQWRTKDTGLYCVICGASVYRTCRSVQDSSEQPDQPNTQLAISRSVASSYWTRSVSLANLSRETYHNRRRAKSVVERQSMPSRTRLCPRKGEGYVISEHSDARVPAFLIASSLDINFIRWYRVILCCRRYCGIDRIHVETVICVPV